MTKRYILRPPNPRPRQKANPSQSSHPELKGKGSTTDKWINLARKAKFQPSNLAALCSVSLRQLERFFVHHFAKTPARWLRECRCRRARQLISQGYSTRAVIDQLHFTDHSHLCHEFKQFYGATPKSFARGFLPKKAAGSARKKQN
jgi:AraC-like DNA-binding protein